MNITIENAIDDLRALIDISRNITINCDKMEIAKIEADSAMISAIASRVIKSLEKSD
jgi:hypothetical protein